MIAYQSRTVLDLHGLAYVRDGATATERNLRLADLLGAEVIGAVRSLDIGTDAGTVVSRLSVAFLSDTLKAAWEQIRALGASGAEFSSRDLAGMSRTSAASAMTALEQLGFIEQVGRDGRERRYRALPLAPLPASVRGPDYCCACGDSFPPGQLNGLCEICYEDKIA